MYPDLFNCIGTNYGAGDSSTTFNLPDLTFTSDNQVPVFGNGKDLAFTDGSILFGPRTSSTSAVAYTTSAYGKDVGTALSSGTGLTSGKVIGIATKSLLGNNPENSGLVAELTASSNVKYLIKAFDGQTPDSALIDITQYAQALANKADSADLANKADCTLSNLTQAGDDHYLLQDFTFIYPNGGTAANPANITASTRYVESNPFPGYYVMCEAELRLNGKWTAINKVDAYSNIYGMGVAANQYEGAIVVQTGSLVLWGASDKDGNPGQIATHSTSNTSAPCRIKVWKIGKITT
jgi:hypothetical protein